MRIYNKGQRAFIIHRDAAIKGCRLPMDSLAKDKAYIDPETTVDVKDAVGVKLLHDYPYELKHIEVEEKSKKE